MNGNSETTVETSVDPGRRSFLKGPLVAGAAGAWFYAG